MQCIQSPCPCHIVSGVFVNNKSLHSELKLKRDYCFISACFFLSEFMNVLGWDTLFSYVSLTLTRSGPIRGDGVQLHPMGAHVVRSRRWRGQLFGVCVTSARVLCCGSVLVVCSCGSDGRKQPESFLRGRRRNYFR